MPHCKSSDPLLSTLLKHLWQRLQPRVLLGMTLQAWHTCIWGVSPIPLQILSSSVRLDGERRCPAIFRSFQKCSNWVQVWTLAGPLKEIQTIVPKPLLRCLSCVVRVVVLLEGEPSPQYEVLRALEQVFIKDLSVLCAIHHSSLDPD